MKHLMISLPGKFFVFITFAALIIGCGTYSKTIQLEMNYRPIFTKNLIYEGTLFKPGQYKQIGRNGSIRVGFYDSFLANLDELKLFKKIYIIPLIKKDPDKMKELKTIDLNETLILKTVTDNIQINYCGDEGCAEMDLTILIYKPDKKTFIYKRYYIIKKTFPASEQGYNQYSELLKALLSRVFEDLSKADFNNPEYEDVIHTAVELK